MSDHDEALEQFNQRLAAREHDSTPFPIADEELQVKPSIAPEVSLRIEDIRRRATADVRAAREAQDRGDPIPEPTLTDQELIAAADETVRACIQPSSFDAWQRLRASDRPNPLTLSDLYKICDLLIARASGLPTGRPAASPAGPPPTTPSSRAARPSKAATRKR